MTSGEQGLTGVRGTCGEGGLGPRGLCALAEGPIHPDVQGSLHSKAPLHGKKPTPTLEAAPLRGGLLWGRLGPVQEGSCEPLVL